MTPAGALVWRTLPAELPWTRPPAGNPTGRHRPTDAQIAEALTCAGVADNVAQWYIVHGPFTELMVHSPVEMDRNLGYPARAIEVAAERDITGTELADIASRLDLTDHQVPVARHDHTVVGDARGGRRYLKRGREILRALGVWPWAHVDDWSRTRRWWREPLVHRALIDWHDRAWTRAAGQLALSARGRYGADRYRSLTAGESAACRAFRDRLVELAQHHE